MISVGSREQPALDLTLTINSKLFPKIVMLSRAIKDDITQILQAVKQHETVPEESMAQIYKELRRIAAARMAMESAGQTLQATALVHEAWLRLFGSNGGKWQNRAHFFAAAALAMRRILIESARRKMSVKRGKRVEHVRIEEMDIAQTLPDERVLLIDEALERLQKQDAELAQAVILKFFGGLTNVEVAEIMGVTERTVQNKWVFARAWLLENIREAVNPTV
jgi:RNA polymerase sigma factor (TIGR02999 family)